METRRLPAPYRTRCTNLWRMRKNLQETDRGKGFHTGTHSDLWCMPALHDKSIRHQSPWNGRKRKTVFPCATKSTSRKGQQRGQVWSLLRFSQQTHKRHTCSRALSNLWQNGWMLVRVGNSTIPVSLLRKCRHPSYSVLVVDILFLLKTRTECSTSSQPLPFQDISVIIARWADTSKRDFSTNWFMGSVRHKFFIFIIRLGRRHHPPKNCTFPNSLRFCRITHYRTEEKKKTTNPFLLVQFPMKCFQSSRNSQNVHCGRFACDIR